MNTLSPTSPSANERLPLLLALIIAITLYRLWVLSHTGLNLYVDEAQYWTWSQNLAWGYFSKPPVIAATIAATTAVCGDGEVCIKSGALLIYPLTALLLWSIARRLFDARTAFWTAITFLTLPGVTFSSAIISTDVPLFLCWAAALRAYLAALDTGAWRWWLAAGAAAGIGLLTKYTMVIFAACAVLHLATTPALRPQLRNPKLYAAMVLAALIFAPNIAWNASHGWPTLQHTAQISGLENRTAAPFSLHWKSLNSFLTGQLAVFGPVLFIAWVVQLAQVRYWLHDDRYRLLACFALPFLGLISVQALLGRANANWAAMTYATATIFVIARLVAAGRTRLMIASLSLHAVLGLLAYHYDDLTRLSGVELTRKTDFYKRVRGWDQVGDAVQQLRDQHPDARLLGDNRDVIAELMYYVRPHPLDMAKWNPDGLIDDHYALTTSITDDLGADFLYISRDAELKPGLADRFDEATPLTPIHVPIRRDWALDFNVWLLRGFRGYQ